MSQDTLITVRGYVTQEPRFWQRTPSKPPAATIRVGSTRRRLNKETGEWQDAETSYYNVRCRRQLAENVHGCLRKGDMVLVRGKVSTRTWMDDQQRVRTEWEIEADAVGHDLTYGWSHFNRGAHTPPSVQAALDQGEAARQDMPPYPDLPDDEAQFGDGESDGESDSDGDSGRDEAAAAQDGAGEPRSPQDAPALADAAAPF